MDASAGVDAWALWLHSGAADLEAADYQSREVDGFDRDATTLAIQAAALPATLLRHDG